MAGLINDWPASPVREFSFRSDELSDSSVFRGDDDGLPVSYSVLVSIYISKRNGLIKRNPQKISFLVTYHAFLDNCSFSVTHCPVLDAKCLSQIQKS